jgi:hypothetical protein
LGFVEVRSLCPILFVVGKLFFRVDFKEIQNLFKPFWLSSRKTLDISDKII